MNINNEWGQYVYFNDNNDIEKEINFEKKVEDPYENIYNDPYYYLEESEDLNYYYNSGSTSLNNSNNDILKKRPMYIIFNILLNIFNYFLK